MIAFEVIDTKGSKQTIEIPGGINLSLMEVLKASDYDVLATCGGMALCATCHIEIKTGGEKLPPPGDSELDMIDTLPNARANSRLACQIRIDEQLNGTCFALMESSA
jgi:ferredoxin